MAGNMEDTLSKFLADDSVELTEEEKKATVKDKAPEPKKDEGTKKKRKSLYTDEEREELKKLKNRRRYYAKALSKTFSKLDIIYTMQSTRPSMSEGLAYSIKNADAGYFDPDNEIKYSRTEDFRAWMAENGDYELLERLLSENNILATEDSQIPNNIPTKRKGAGVDHNEVIRDDVQKINELDAKIYDITTKAHDRRSEDRLRSLMKKNGVSTFEEMLELSNKLKSKTKVEQEAIDYLKKRLAKGIVSAVGLDAKKDDKSKILSRAIVQGVMTNPKEGFMLALKETVRDSVAKKYGNDGANIASSIVGLITGSGSVKGVGLSIFDGIINQTGLNKDLMKEKAADLIDSGKSDELAEQTKLVGRDLALDIVKDVLTSGGNLYVAAAKIGKDILGTGAKIAVKTAKKKIGL